MVISQEVPDVETLIEQIRNHGLSDNWQEPMVIKEKTSQMWNVTNEAVRRLKWRGWDVHCSFQYGIILEIIIEKRADPEISYSQRIEMFREIMEGKTPHASRLTGQRNIIQVALQICDVLESELDKLNLLALFIEQGLMTSITFTAPEAMGLRWNRLVGFLNEYHSDKPEVVAIFNGPNAES